MERITAKLASRNEHKLAELARALPGWELELLEGEDFPAEQGSTYCDNARAKARFGRVLGPHHAWIFGEDSGVEVEGLDGAPGLHSARWAGEDDPVERLLAELEGVEDEGRRARYVCALVCITPELEEVRGTGMLEGEIARERRGSEGFGYDPIFVPAGEVQTVAELGNEWKARNSHRARAAAALLEAIARRGLESLPELQPPGGRSHATS